VSGDEGSYVLSSYSQVVSLIFWLLYHIVEEAKLATELFKICL